PDPEHLGDEVDSRVELVNLEADLQGFARVRLRFGEAPLEQSLHVLEHARIPHRQGIAELSRELVVCAGGASERFTPAELEQIEDLAQARLGYRRASALTFEPEQLVGNGKTLGSVARMPEHEVARQKRVRERRRLSQRARYLQRLPRELLCFFAAQRKPPAYA